jgi:hypothetical protein
MLYPDDEFGIVQSAKTAAAGGCSVRYRTWDAQIHLRTRSDFAPYIELRANLLGALAHARQTPMLVPSRVEKFRIDALAIIPYS